ncbi:acyltransferase domain-containing protein [Antribacter sp. KLBMP9083]|uniref:Acyltransferase domain-containing protein n=1 Tax=Antribacter soli TaxID=2910976 RepID=A0AA41U930_9MICO|nr:type I polyketide synthase [Antribacter soli]MCF4123361.1 acyltransferase domain-containing protein [Antribacter soli]
MTSTSRTADPTTAAEPIAITGMGCRFPGGVNSPDDLWHMLVNGLDGIRDVPEERWAAYAAAFPSQLRATTKRGGFIDNAAAFDAAFFGITPREAEQMDPQQRILLETAWEALENAGVPPTSLAAGDAGVFIGVGSDDYGRQMLEDLPRIEAWTGIGASMCATANRISYHLDLRGPSMAVDTACSSSLVAIHLACQALRSGETQLALAGGVNIMAGPGLPMVLDAAGATSPDGTSKSFDASADGYGRGEGAGVVVLKRLSDAQRDGDLVLAVIRGSAVQQDGRTNGIMAPSGEAQAAVARQALQAASVDPRTVGYVEAHGTGTRAGDPIEANALSSVYGVGRDAGSRCLIGSVKPNIGHLEAGAGIAGVIKTVLSLVHAEIPATIRHEKPTPAVDWESSGLEVVAQRRPWPAGSGPRRAGVSSFGYGGTVGHLVLEQAPERLLPAGEDRRQRVFPVSGTSADAVRGYAARLADRLRASDDVRLADVAHTLTTRRDHAAVRAAVVAETTQDLVAGLDLLAAGDDSGHGPSTAVRAHDAVWVFSGHGSQWSGMGRDLLANEPVFAAVIDEIDPVFQEEAGYSPRDVIVTGDLGGTDRIQPMIFALQVGLAAVLRSRGLRPAAVIGHSVGEIAAAVAAGMLDLTSGARLVCRRSALLPEVSGAGAMAMVTLPFEEVQRRLADHPDVHAAISASPGSTVIAGTPDGVDEVSAAWDAEGIRVRKVSSDVAFHSPQMDPLCGRLADSVSDLVPHQPQVPVYSTALSETRSGAPRDGAYWAANLRNPVQLTSAVRAALEDGHRSFVELAPHPVVAHSIEETVAETSEADVFVTGTLRRERPEVAGLLGAVAAAHVRGVTVDWAAAAEEHAGPVPLPTTVWQHQDYWRAPGSAVSAQQHDPGSRTLLGALVELADGSGTRVWQTQLDFETRPYPGEHPIGGTEVLPAAVLLTTFVAAFDGAGLRDVELRSPVTVTGTREVQVIREQDSVRLASRRVDGDQDVPTLHTFALRGAATTAGGGVVDVASVTARCGTQVPPGAVTQRLRDVGVADIGFPWRFEEIRTGGEELFARVVASTDDDVEGTDHWASLFDAVLSVPPLVFPGDPVLRMPSRVGELRLFGPAPAEALITLRPSVGAPDPTTVDVQIAGTDGVVLAELRNLRFTEIDPPGSSGGTLVHRVEWESLPVPPAPSGARVVLVGDGHPLAAAIQDAVELGGGSVTTVADPDALAGLGRTLDRSSILVLPPSSGVSDTAAAAAAAAWRVARTVQVVTDTAPLGAQVLAVTHRGDDANAVEQAPVWGMSAVLGTEHPDLWGGVLDVDPDHAEGAVAAVPAFLGRRESEPVVRLDGSGAWARRLRPAAASSARPALTCSPDGTYLITGGLGVLGLEIASWLAGRGASRIVLAGRSGLPPRSTWDQVSDPADRRRIDAVLALETRGVTVRAVSVDITDRDQVAAALTPDALGMPPIRGVVHAAGVLDSRTLATLGEDSLRTVMRPKVDGALVLDDVFPPGDLEFCVYFSSVGLLLGLTGQTSYAAANSFLDALARRRRANGGAETVSLGWTSWRAMGMADSTAVAEELAGLGAGDISRDEAFRSWDTVFRSGEAHAAVVRVLEVTAGGPAVLRGLAAEPSATSDDAGSGLRDLAGDDLVSALTALVVAETAQQTGQDPAGLDARSSFTELGLDSVMTMAVRRRLQKVLGLKLPAAVMWDHPDVGSFAGHLAGRLQDDARVPVA